MAIQNNFPAISPSLSLDFANVGALDPRITFARASAATYYGTETAKAEENLFQYSQEFDDNYWLKGPTITVTANGATAPDGTSTAEVFSSSSNANLASNRITSSNAAFEAGTYTFSVFMRSATNQTLLLRGLESGGSVFVSSASAVVTSTWTRFTLTFTITLPAVRVTIGADGTDIPTNVEIWGAQLEQRSTATAYTPTTDQPITNYIPVLESAASGEARFDHNPNTFESLGLLIEESRTNLLLRSEEFDDAGWAKARASIVANTIVAPSGELTGDKLVEDTTASNTHLVTRFITPSLGDVTFSCYVKAAERSRLRITSFEATTPSSPVNAFFDVSAGTVISGTGTITAVGNGWYRCSASGTVVAAVGTQFTITLVNTGTNISYTGDGFSGIFIWGAQLEEGAFPTSYIPTTTAQVTRAADAATMTGANFSSWYRADEGTLYVESRCPNGTSGNINRFASLNDGTTQNRMEIDTGSGSASVVRIVSNNTNQGGPFAGSYTDFELRKSALGIKLNNFTLVANSATNSVNSALVPVVNRLFIGQSPAAASNFLNGTIRKLSFYPIRVTDAELQGLAS